MKKLFNSALRCNGQAIAITNQSSRITTSILLCCIFLTGTLFTSCKKEAAPAETESLATVSQASTADVVNEYSGLSSQTMWELQQARAATARYRKLENATKDGYVDINVIMPNMGYHYMKPSIVDETFDVRNPEILVYNKDENGNFYLVAVEYAVPLTYPTPEGFTGSADVWNGTSGFPFWLLHAWVWNYNPSGVFSPTNPLIHLH